MATECDTGYLRTAERWGGDVFYEASSENSEVCSSYESVIFRVCFYQRPIEFAIFVSTS
jgi:hypothetical protein